MWCQQFLIVSISLSCISDATMCALSAIAPEQILSVTLAENDPRILANADTTVEAKIRRTRGTKCPICKELLIPQDQSCYFSLSVLFGSYETKNRPGRKVQLEVQLLHVFVSCFSRPHDRLIMHSPSYDVAPLRSFARVKSRNSAAKAKAKQVTTESMTFLGPENLTCTKPHPSICKGQNDRSLLSLPIVHGQSD